MHSIIRRIIYLFCFHLTSSSAYEISPYIYDGILHNECLKRDGKCYPYFIRVNSKYNEIKRLIGKNKFSSSIIDCKNERECIRVTNKLILNNITNFDMGPFQINYHHHKKTDVNKMYNINLSKIEVKKILTRLINKYGYSWKTLGKYHSFQKDRNKRYYLKLYAYLKKNNML